MRDLYVSCSFATACVTVDHDNTIVDTAPIFKAFKGQNLSHLTAWLEKRSGEKPIVEDLNSGER